MKALNLPNMIYSKIFNITLILFLLNITIATAQFREIYRGTNSNDNIEGMSFISPSTGFVAFNNFIGFTTDSGRTYIHRTVDYSNTDYNGYSVNLTFGFIAKGVIAFSIDSVFATGHFGTEPSILFSSNQGQSWKLVFHKNYNAGASAYNEGITDIKFPGNGKTGFAVHHEEVIKTTDRGQTWVTALSVPNGRLKKLSFPTLNTGFVSGADKVFKTSNTGTSWTSLILPGNDPGTEFDNVFFTTENNGYLLDNAGHKMYRSIDGGFAWTKANNEIIIPIGANDIYFTNDSTGFAVGFLYQVYKTTDFGKTWEPCKRDNGYQYLYFGLNRVYFYNSQIGWSGGMAEYLMITTDGGKTTLPKAYFQIDSAGYYATGKISLVNYSKTNYTYKLYKNGEFISTSYNTQYTHTVTDQTDTIKLIVTDGINSDTAIQYQYFTYEAFPVINTYSPKVGSYGTLVTINGSNFSKVTRVQFGSVDALSFSVISDQQINAVVANGASGNVTVYTHYVSGTATGFTYSAPPVDNPPQISSFSPASGEIGTTVTIQGNNFGPDVDDNLVFFGEVRATLISCSTTQIVCKVPLSASCQPITILNTINHLSGNSLTSFNVTFANPRNFTSHSFVNEFNVVLSAQADFPVNLSAFDIDGDGKPDLISNEKRLFRDSVRVYRNISSIGKPNFEDPKGIFYIGGYSACPITISDLDGDGKPDFIAAANYNDVSISRNTSIPGLILSEPVFTVRCADGPQMAASGDLDNDGRPDLVVPTFNNNLVSILRNTSVPGVISFAPSINFTTGGNSQYAAIGDIDGDGKADVVVLSTVNMGDSANFSFFKNTSIKGNISFSSKIDIKVPWFLGSQIYLHDINSDGKLDVIILDLGTYMVFKNLSSNGIFSLARPVYLPSNNGHGTSIENFNGDDKPDLVGGGAKYLYLIENFSTKDSIKSNIPIGVSGVYPYSGEIGATTAADFDGDGKPDIAANQTSTFNHFISVFRNIINDSIVVTTCPISGTIEFDSDIPGSGFQWQCNSGSGFQNISDNNVTTGTNTGSLHLSNIPEYWNNYKFRCVSGSNFSSTFILQLKIPPQSPGPITGPLNVTVNTPYTYFIDPVPGAYSYSWTSLNGNTKNLPQTTSEPQVIVKWKSINGSDDILCVKAQNECGVSDQTCSQNIVLPVTLLTFTANKTGNSTEINWATVYEININHYVIERSSDGMNFSQIGTVYPTNLSQNNNYHFKDNSPENGKNYYRLKIANSDGYFTYSKIVQVEYTFSPVLQVLPNRIENNSLHLLIKADKASNSQIIILDIHGHQVLKKVIVIITGTSEETISLNNISSGTYIVQLINNFGSCEQKFIKLK